MLRWAAIVLVGLGCLMRVAHLDSDPNYYGWWGHVFDEGRWVEQARMIALHNTLPERLGHNALVAPLFELGTTLVFVITGVSLQAGRLLPALCGCALVVLVWWWLRGRVSPSATLLGVAMVAFSADLVVLSRIAAPEAPVMLGTAAAFMVLAANPPTRGRMIAAGLLSAVVLGIKLTSLFTVAIFGLVALSLRPPGEPVRARIADGAWFIGGVALPAVVAAPVALFLADRAGFDVWHRLGVFSQFFGLRDPYALASLPFEAIDSPVIVPSSLGLWLVGLAALGARDHRSDDFRWIRAASTWSVMFIVVFFFQLYFPERYRVHVLVPLALVTAHAVSRLEVHGLAGVVERLRAARGSGRLLGAGFLAFPAAVQLAALVAPFTAWAGVDPERLTTRFALTLLSWATLAALLRRRVDQREVVEALIGFSIVVTLLEFAHWIVAPYTVGFFLTSFGGIPGRLGLLLAGAVLTLAFVRGPRAVRVPGAAACAAGILVVAWSAHLWSGIVRPTYTMRDTIRDVGRVLEGHTEVWQDRAESLLIETGVGYHGFDVSDYRLDLPPVVVVALPMHEGNRFLHSHYEPVRHYELYVPAGHQLPPRPSGVCDGPGQCFAVMRRRVAAED